MLEEGQKVWWPNPRIKGDHQSGVVVEVSGNRAYIEQSNGVETDFAISELLTEKPKSLFDRAETQSSFLSATSDNPEHELVLSRINPLVVSALASLYNQLPFRQESFDSLPAAIKLNYISAMCSTSYETIKKYTDEKSSLLTIILAEGLSRNLGLTKPRSPEDQDEVATHPSI